MSKLLSARALNRISLDRQMLLKRGAETPKDVIGHLFGLQGQVGNAPHVALWNRVEGFTQDDLNTLLRDKAVVRATMMRGTVHIIGADDFLDFRMGFQPLLERHFSSAYLKLLNGQDREVIRKAGRALVESGPIQGGEIERVLFEKFPQCDKHALGMLVRYLEPLVHVPPAGLWDKGAPPKVTAAKFWLGREPSAKSDLEALVLRYLKAFGPASVMDAQAWCGLTKLGEIFETLRPRLEVFKSEDGRELFDLRGREQAYADEEAPVRILADYDNAFMGYADRSRIISEEHWQHMALKNGVRPIVIRDGFACAGWKMRKAKGGRVLEIEGFEKLSRVAQREIGTEGEKLLAFAGPEGTKDIQFGVVEG